MGIEELLADKRDEILAVPLELRSALIAAQHGAYNVRVFGSVARGEARDDSDVDFLVEIEESRRLLDRIALIQNPQDLLGRKVDVAKPQNLHQLIRDRVLQEAIPLFNMNCLKTQN
jgi:predicted nucleotidyltransferase